MHVLLLHLHLQRTMAVMMGAPNAPIKPMIDTMIAAMIASLSVPSLPATTIIIIKHGHT